MDTGQQVKAGELEQHFYGAATVGERGQIVIPAEARKKYGIETGDKLLIMGTRMQKGLMLFKIDALREAVNVFQSELQKAERAAAENDGTED